MSHVHGGARLVCSECGGCGFVTFEEIGFLIRARFDRYAEVGWRGTAPEGTMIPEGYGIAYYEPGRPTAIIMPIPFNLIIGAWRALMIWMMCPPWRLMEFRLELARKRGFEEGLDAKKRRELAEHLFGGIEVKLSEAIPRGKAWIHPDTVNGAGFAHDIDMMKELFQRQNDER